MIGPTTEPATCLREVAKLVPSARAGDNWVRCADSGAPQRNAPVHSVEPIIARAASPKKEVRHGR